MDLKHELIIAQAVQFFAVFGLIAFLAMGVTALICIGSEETKGAPAKTACGIIAAILISLSFSFGYLAKYKRLEAEELMKQIHTQAVVRGIKEEGYSPDALRDILHNNQETE